MTKKTKIVTSVLLIILVVVVVLIFQPFHKKTISENLQSQAWSLTDTVGDGMTVQFQDKRAQFGELGSYGYVVDEKRNNIKFSDDDKNAISSKKSFSIKKDKDKYILTPLDEASKDWGTITLAPKK